MADYYANPYRGTPGINHVSEDVFKVFIFSSQASLVCSMLPGWIFGSEVRPRKYNRDYIIALCDEAARRREVLRGKTPTHFMPAPTPTNHSWEKMFWRHLHRKRWTQGRMGGGHSPVIP